MEIRNWTMKVLYMHLIRQQIEYGKCMRYGFCWHAYLWNISQRSSLGLEGITQNLIHLTVLHRSCELLEGLKLIYWLSVYCIFSLYYQVAFFTSKC